MKLPLLIGAFACLGSLAAGYAETPDAPKTSLAVFPDGETSANPRVACIPPVKRDGGVGQIMDVEAVFRYSLAPFVQFPQGGSLTCEVRDNPKRKAYEVLALEDGDRRLVLEIQRTADGKKPRLVYTIAGREAASAVLPNSLPQLWTAVEIRWDAQQAELSLPGKDKASLKLPQAFDPKAISLQTAAVDQINLQGDGSFVLGWENSYAATVTPRSGSTDTLAKLLGFDTYFVSEDATKRDCPYIHLLNGSDQDRQVTVDFVLHGEISAYSEKWSQSFRIPAGSSSTEPVVFPRALNSDVYHFRAASDALKFQGSDTKHFVFASVGAGGKPVPKFGLHDSDRATFGFWPDALPITLAHHYLRWAYVYGPAWESEVDTTATTPVEELNWNPRIDWVIRQGLTPFVSLLSCPDTVWMREKEYEGKMKVYPWGKIGGYPNLTRYREFIEAVATRYKGRVPMYEVENEPNAWMGGMPAEDYAGIARTAAEAIRANDPAARIFGISGTGSFVPWMRDVFKANGTSGLTGISIHTYVTPRLPEAALLPEKLAEVNEVIKSSGQSLDLINSETGTFVSLRETVDRPIAKERLEELIQQGVSPFFQAKGWPNYAIDERSGAISITRNALFNFLAGAEYFTFFGWNDRWPKPDWWGQPGEACFALISASRDGERTPSRYTLAIGVLTEQLRAAILSQGKAIHKGGVSGGLFPTSGGGEVAMLWSAQGKRSVVIEYPDTGIEGVSLFGQKLALPSAGKTGQTRLEIGEEPIYLHTTKPGLQLLPSPVISVTSDISGGFSFTLVNHYDQSWKGEVTFSDEKGWKTTPAAVDFSLEKGQRASFQAWCEIPAGTPKGSYPMTASLILPDGEPFVFPVSIRVRPTVVIPRVAEGFDWRNPDGWKSQPPLSLDQADQVVVGQPPLLSSLQEERFWKGSNELSAQARFASDGKSLFVYLVVTDANHRAPQKWPGVLGSCVELFLDQRTGKSLGQAAYGPGVTQLLIRPPSSSDPEPTVHQATEKFGTLIGVQATGGELRDGKYWIALSAPLSTPGESFGLDIGINGPPKEGLGRKSQMMLFGGAGNGSDASQFGSAKVAR